MPIFGSANPIQNTATGLRAEASRPHGSCPCCGGRTKLYRRKMNSGMAAALCWLVANHGREYAHVAQGAGNIVLRNRDYSKLELWGFIEQKPNEGGAKRTSGVWRATPEGEAFAMRETTAPSHAYVRSPGNVLEGFETTQTTIVEALGEHFHYQELMRGGGA